MVPRSPLQEGPIFLDKLFCTGLDQTLQDCSLGIRAVGLTTCNHTQDVWLQCSGNASLSGARFAELNQRLLLQISTSVSLKMEGASIPALIASEASSVRARLVTNWRIMASTAQVSCYTFKEPHLLSHMVVLCCQM